MGETFTDLARFGAQAAAKGRIGSQTFQRLEDNAGQRFEITPEMAFGITMGCLIKLLRLNRSAPSSV